MRTRSSFPFLPLVLLAAAALVLTAARCGDGARPATPGSSPTASVRATRTQAPALSPTLRPEPTAAIRPTGPFPGTAVPFQTLAWGFGLGGGPLEPALLAATDLAGRETLSALLDSGDRALLSAVDLEDRAVLAAFWGIKPSGGFSITITGVLLDDGELTVTVDLRENDPAFPAIEAQTHPYHVVTIDRETSPDLSSLQYRLVSGDTVLAIGKLP